MGKAKRNIYNKMADPEPWAGGPDGTIPATVLNDPMAPRMSVIYSYKSRVSMILGIILLVSGTLLVLAATTEMIVLKRHLMDLSTYFHLRRLQQMIFSCVLETPDFIAGILAIVAAKKRNKCTIIGTMVMSIIAAVVGAITMLSSLGTLVSHSIGIWVQEQNSTAINGTFTHYGYTHISIWNPPDKYEHSLRYVAVNQVVAAILGVLSMVVAIWLSTLGCQVFCCNKALVDRGYVQAQVAYVPKESGGDATTEQPVVYLSYNKPPNPLASGDKQDRNEDVEAPQNDANEAILT